MVNRFVVVGAGPAGLSLALQLARSGHPVALVEASRQFSRQFRGDALMPCGQEALARMGLSDLVAGLPQRPLAGWSVWVNGRKLFAVAEPMGSLQPCRLVPQQLLLEALLAEALQEPQFQWHPGQAVKRLQRSGGRINGVELAVNVPLSMVAKPLDGFGIAINHSDTKSSIPIGAGQIPGLNPDIKLSIPLPGLSRRVTNVRAYFEKAGFAISVAQRTRSDFLGEIKDYKDDSEITFIKGESVVDLQVGYTFPDRSFLKGLSVLLQANNVTDTEFQQYTTNRNSPTDKKRFGKTYLFGVNYKF